MAERLIAAGGLLTDEPEALLPTIRAILTTARSVDARAVFETTRQLARLRRKVAQTLAAFDFLFVPTTPTIYRIDDLEADPLRLNAALGAYTTFVNPLDLAAIAVPTGLRGDRLPTGATLVGPWGADAKLAAFASALHRATSQSLGATDKTFGDRAATGTTPPPAPVRLDSRLPSSVRIFRASR